MLNSNRPPVISPRILAATLGILFCLSLWLLQSSRAQEASADANNLAASQASPTPCPTCGGDEDKPHTLAASYYSTKNGLTAVLMLNNKGPKPLEVKPTLYNLDGQQFELPVVMVEGESFREVDMREFGIEGTAFDEGSLQLFHRGKDLVLGAQVKLINSQQSLIFEEKLLEISTEIGARRLEGVWYLPTPKTQVRLILSNTSIEAVPASILIDGIAPKQKSPFAVTLNPHETRVFDVRRDISGNHGGKFKEVGGITIEHSSPAGALLARVLIDDAAAGYSSSLRFYDSQKAKSTRLHGAGVRLGEVNGEKLTPVIVARNTGDEPTRITGRIPYTTTDGQTGTVTIPAMRLARGETKIIETSAALKRSGIEQSIVTAGLEFEYTGVPGSVVMSAQSMTKSGDHAFQVPLWDIKAQRSSTGGYPWNVEGTLSTMVYLKNVTDHTQRYVMEVGFAGGQHGYTTGSKTIEAGQTLIIDVRNLRDEQVPDANGRTIPLNASRGQIHWSARSIDALPIIGRSEQVDLANGISSSYACQNCCQDTFNMGWIESITFGIVISEGTSQYTAFEQDISCYGELLAPFNPYPFWNSADWSVAACDSSGLVTGQTPGTTSIQASWIAYEPFREIGGGNECAVRERNVITEAPTEVRPQYTVSGNIMEKIYENPDPPYEIVYRQVAGCRVQCPVFSFESLIDYGEFAVAEQEYDASTKRCDSRFRVFRKPDHVSGCYERVGRL